MLTLENLIGDPREIECFSREPIANSAPRISVETSASMIKEKGRFRRYVFTFTREEKLDSRFEIYGNGWLLPMLASANVAISNRLNRAFCRTYVRNSIFKCQTR